MRNFVLPVTIPLLCATLGLRHSWSNLLPTAPQAKAAVASGKEDSAANSNVAAPLTPPTTSSLVPSQAGKMVFFSSTPFGATMPAKTQSQFSSADHIYARIQLDQPVEKAMDVSRDETGAKVYVTFKFTAKQQDYSKSTDSWSMEFDSLLTPEMLKQNYLNFDLFSQATQGRPRFVELHSERHEPPAALFCNGSWAGLATVTMDFQKQDQDGTFTMTAPPAGTKPLACQAAKQFKQKEVSSHALPAELKRASGTFRDPQLSAAAIRQKFQASGGVEVYRIVVTDGPDYTLVKNRLGIPLYKITKPIYNTYRDTQTGNCYYTHDAFRREYMGNGTFGPPELATLSVTPVQIDCAVAEGSK